MSTSYTFTGTGARANATQVNSSSVGSYTGDWCIETQSMLVRYIRVPTAPQNQYSYILEPSSLSGVTVRSDKIIGTRLFAVVNASYQIYKETGTTYLTASDVQLQRFSVAGFSYDKYGNNYGIVSGTKLGPFGAIATTQPYRRRVPWDDMIHSENSQSIVGSNHAALVFNGQGILASIMHPMHVLSWLNADFNSHNLSNTQPHLYSNATDVLYKPRSGNSMNYLLFGTNGYNPTLESPQQLFNFLNSIGEGITNYDLWRSDLIPQTHIIGTIYSTQEIPNSDATVGISQYSNLRHDFT